MAIYMLRVSIIGRTSGHKAVAAAAYRSGEKLFDDRYQELQDYSRKQNIERSEVFAPSQSPDWVFDRETLWNNVEEAEKRKDAQLAREVLVAIPRELSTEKRWQLVEDFTKKEFVDYGMIADVSMHNGKAADGGENPHAHIMLTMRDISPEGFGQKNREWNNAVFTKDDYIADKSSLVGLRAKWADYANEALANNGNDTTVSHLSNEAQGLAPAMPAPSLTATHIHQKEQGTSYAYNWTLDKQAKEEIKQFYSDIKPPEYSAAMAQNRLVADYENIRHRQQMQATITPIELSHVERLRRRQNIEQSMDLGMSR